MGKALSASYPVPVTGLVNPFALRKAKIAYDFGLSECNRVNEKQELKNLRIQ